MPALAPLPTSARYRLSPRAAAVGLQLLLWGLLAGFYFAWNSRANYHFDTPIWPVVLMEMGFAVLLFNALVYLIIPRLAAARALPAGATRRGGAGGGLPAVDVRGRPPHHRAAAAYFRFAAALPDLLPAGALVLPYEPGRAV